MQPAPHTCSTAQYYITNCNYSTLLVVLIMFVDLVNIFCLTESLVFWLSLDSFVTNYTVTASKLFMIHGVQFA